MDMCACGMKANISQQFYYFWYVKSHLRLGEREKLLSLKSPQVHKIIGFAPILLQVVMSDQVDMPVRQAGKIVLKFTCIFCSFPYWGNVTLDRK